MNGSRPILRADLGGISTVCSYAARLIVVVLAMSEGLLRAQTSAAPAAASGLTAPSSGQIARWIERLDDDQFAVRTDATEKLIEAGAVAVEPVRTALEGANLEVTMRAIYVLRELALSMDMTVQQRGVKALREVAQTRHGSAARLAREAMVALGQRRQRQTLDQLEQLGATIRRYAAAGMAAQRPLEVEIGPDWEGTMQDVNRLVWVPDLFKVTFDGPQVTDGWIAPIRDLENLRYLAIKNARITDDALERISQLKTLVYLDLMYTPVTDAGFVQLKRMKSLRQIRCFGTRITREAADRFQAELAAVEVQHKMGAFLGVSCQQPPWPCQVSRVTDGSAAKLAGVQAGDIIVGFDGQPVASFDDLRKLIGKKKVGDSAAIEVARGGRPKIVAIPRQPPAQLGLKGKSMALGVRVEEVDSGKLADEAGVQKDDLILALDDDRVQSMDQLATALNKETPLPISRLQILRDIEIEKMKVTFGQWNEP